MIAPDACATMAEVRAGVDATDAELVALLARRFAFMAAAARIKTTRAAVRDEVRKAAVIARASAAAAAAGLPAGLVPALWEELVEASIAYELALWDALRTKDTDARPAVAADGASDGARTRDLRRDRPAL